jgi:hypothetical protein
VSTPPRSPHAPGRPPAVWVVSLVLLLQGIALLGFAAWSAYGMLAVAPSSLGAAAFLTLLLLILGGWALAVGHFLFRGYRWTRSAAVVIQLLAVVLAMPALTSGAALAGVAVVVPAGLALVLLFSRHVGGFAVRPADGSKAL